MVRPIPAGVLTGFSHPSHCCGCFSVWKAPAGRTQRQQEITKPRFPVQLFRSRWRRSEWNGGAQGDHRSYESGRLEAGFLLGGSAQLCGSRVGWLGGVGCCLLDQGLMPLRVKGMTVSQACLASLCADSLPWVKSWYLLESSGRSGWSWSNEVMTLLQWNFPITGNTQ